MTTRSLRALLAPRLTLSLLLPLALLVGCTATRDAAEDRSGADLATDSSVVAVLGGEAVTLDEFEARYARSVGGRAEAADDSLAAYEDFLQRYSDFRLKVRAAREAGLDDDPTIREEIASYRVNLARPYLRDREILEPIMREIHERQAEVVSASHILLRVAPDASPEDTLAAYRQIELLADSIRGGADFGALAVAFSEDPSAQRPAGQPGSRGDLGTFSAGQMVAPFEDAAYATPVGALSPIIRTQFGYHILQVHSRAPRTPDVEIAHIMLVPQSPQREDSLKVFDTLRDIQSRLAAGEDFAELAREFSQDVASAQRGGLLGVLPSTQPMPEAPTFRDAAFAIDEEGEVSDIVATPFGFHLIKLVDRKEQQTFEEAYDELKQAASRSAKAQAAEERFARDARALRGETVDSALVRATFADVPADSVRDAFRDGLSETVRTQTVATLGDSTYTLGALADFGTRAQLNDAPTAEARVFNLLDRFLLDRAITYETAALEDRDPEFAALMQEFRDGLVLFKLMEDSVWTAASKDTTALEAYYEAHRAEYTWPDRTRLVGFVSASDSVLTDVAVRLDAGATVADVAAAYAADTTAALRVDTTLVAGPTGSVFDRALALNDGARTAPLAYAGARVILVRDGEEAARPKTFREALAEVISDYQGVLEAELLDTLRTRYAVRLFPERLSRAFAGAATAGAAGTDAGGDATAADAGE